MRRQPIAERLIITGSIDRHAAGQSGRFMAGRSWLAGRADHRVYLLNNSGQRLAWRLPPTYWDDTGEPYDSKRRS